MNSGPARLAWIVGGLVLAVVLFDVLLLAFAGVLFSVFLRTLADALSAATRLSARWALVVVVVSLVALVALALARVAPDIGGEIDQLVSAAPGLAEDATSWLTSYGWGRWVLERAGDATGWLTEPGTLQHAASIIGTTVGLFGTLFVTLLVGVFIAAEPRAYRNGMLRLVPVERRALAATLIRDVDGILRAWLLGKFVAMAAIFAVTWAGLALLGVPIALTLALLAAALTFIPNFGPVLAAVPAVLLGLQQGTGTALAVAGLYVGAQAVESYLLTPLIQRRTASLPPALTLLAQVAMGVLAGGMGLILATPLVAAILTIARGLTPPVVEPNAATNDR